MDWRKQRTSETSTVAAREKVADAEGLALVKAAAWAWYQHGSGSEGRAARESELGRRVAGGLSDVASHAFTCGNRPSRYKLEAMATAVGSPRGAAAPMTLLDVYEIERITRDLERLGLMSNGQGDTGAGHGWRVAEAATAAESRRKAARKEVAAGGFWGRHAVAICGTRGNVVAEASTLVRRRVRRKETPAMVQSMLGKMSTDVEFRLKVEKKREKVGVKVQ